MSQEQNDDQNEHISDSESNSDWYEYPESDYEELAEKSMSQDTNEQISNSESNSNLISPEVEKQDFSCRCGSVFEDQEDLNDHVMNNSYCYDFYMYQDV